jgi:hypothetical protein
MTNNTYPKGHYLVKSFNPKSTEWYHVMLEGLAAPTCDCQHFIWHHLDKDGKRVEGFECKHIKAAREGVSQK